MAYKISIVGLSIESHSLTEIMNIPITGIITFVIRFNVQFIPNFIFVLALPYKILFRFKVKSFLLFFLHAGEYLRAVARVKPELT